MLLQQKLIALGYLTGTADGAYGDATVAAVKAFQSANGLKADGQAGKIMKYKMREQAVSELRLQEANSIETA